METPLLSTKLFIPEPRKDLVIRKRLIELLDSGLDNKLTLVSAPAGFGKSTLLGSWTSHTKAKAHVAWITLDENDNDLTRFLTYVIAALQTIMPDLGQGILPALKSPGMVHNETLLTLLLNEIAEFSQNIVLILDDYHLIESSSIDKALIFILSHLPSNLHLMVSSRSDPTWPLARMRGYREMEEIRAVDLRFSVNEASIFLNQVMNFHLSDTQVASLEERTEGWITGLQLTALSIQKNKNVDAFVSAFTQSNRYILDYLGEEVLARQPYETQTFLLKTSILKHMTGSLCNAVTGQNDGVKMLVNLEKGNLFIIPLDGEGHWFRYHHLFKDLLFHRLNMVYPDQIHGLHDKASIWCLKDGKINDALFHAFAAGNNEFAAGILEDYWQEFFVRGELAKLHKMLDALGLEITNNHAILRMAYCMIFSQTGKVKQIPVHLDFVRSLITQTSEFKTPLTSNWAAMPSLLETMEAIVSLDSGQFNKAVEYAKRAILLIPEDASPVDRRRLILGANFRLGQAYRMLGELDQASSVLLEVLDMLKTTESYYVVSTVLQLISIYQEIGKKQETLKLCEETLSFITYKHWDELPPVGQIYLTLADIQVDIGKYEEARDNLKIGKRLVEQQMTPEITNKLREIEVKLESVSKYHQSQSDLLTQRELEVLQLIAQGLSNGEISEKLFLALSTVKGYNQNIFRKLNAKRRTEAVSRARELNLI